MSGNTNTQIYAERVALAQIVNELVIGASQRDGVRSQAMGDAISATARETLRRELIASGKGAEILIGSTVIKIDHAGSVVINNQVVSEKAAGILLDIVRETQAGISAEASDRALQEYFSAVRLFSEQPAYATLASTRVPSLTEIFVEPAFINDAEEYVGNTDRISMATVIRDWMASDLPLVISGPGGCGKSSTLRYFARNSWDKPHLLGLPAPVIPMFIRLKELPESRGATVEGRLWDALERAADLLIVGNPPPSGFLAAWPDRVAGGWLLLFDGLDEVPSFQRPKLLLWLRSLTQSLPSTRIVIATRTGLIDEIRTVIAVTHAPIAEFDNGQRELLAQNILGKDAKTFLSLLPDANTLWTTALSITLAILQYGDRQSIPSTPAHAYRMFLEALHGEAIQRNLRDQLGEEITNRFGLLLEVLGWRHLQERLGVSVATVRETLEASLRTTLPNWTEADIRNAIDRITDALGARSGIVRLLKEKVNWEHETFADFLTALHLAREGGLRSESSRWLLSQWENKDAQTAISFLLTISTRYSEFNLSARDEPHVLNQYVKTILPGARLGFIASFLTESFQGFLKRAFWRGEQNGYKAEQDALLFLGNAWLQGVNFSRFACRVIAKPLLPRVAMFVETAGMCSHVHEPDYALRGLTLSLIRNSTSGGYFDSAVAELVLEAKMDSSEAPRVAKILRRAWRHDDLLSVLRDCEMPLSTRLDFLAEFSVGPRSPQLREVLLTRVLPAIRSMWDSLRRPVPTGAAYIAYLLAMPWPSSLDYCNREGAFLLVKLLAIHGQVGDIAAMGNDSHIPLCLNVAALVERADSIPTVDWVESFASIGGRDLPSVLAEAMGRNLATKGNPSDLTLALCTADWIEYGTKANFLSGLASGNATDSLIAVATASDIELKIREVAADALTSLDDPQGNAALLEVYNQRLESSSANRDARLSRARLLFELEKYDESSSDCGILLKADPSDVEALRCRSQCWFMCDKDDLAIADLTLAIDISPSDGDLFHKRGKAFYFNNQFQNASADLEIAIEFGYESGWPSSYLGCCRYHEGRYAEALPLFAAARSGDAATETTRRFEAWCHLFCWNVETALSAFESLYATDPDQADVALAIGYCLLNVGKPADALESFDRALALEPDHSDRSRGLLGKSDALLMLNRPVEARDCIEAVPDNVDCYDFFLRGLVLGMCGRQDEPMSALEMAMQLARQEDALCVNTNVYVALIAAAQRNSLDACIALSAVLAAATDAEPRQAILRECRRYQPLFAEFGSEEAIVALQIQLEKSLWPKLPTVPLGLRPIYKGLLCGLSAIEGFDDEKVFALHMLGLQASLGNQIAVIEIEDSEVAYIQGNFKLSKDYSDHEENFKALLPLDSDVRQVFVGWLDRYSVRQCLFSSAVSLHRFSNDLVLGQRKHLYRNLDDGHSPLGRTMALS